MSRPAREHWRRVSRHYWSGPVQQSVLRSLQGDRWKYGPRARAVEAAVARRLDVPPEWVIATNSCTSALAAATTIGYVTGAPIMTWPSTFAAMMQENETAEAVYRGEDIDSFELRVLVDCGSDGWPVGPVNIAVDLWGRKYPGRRPNILDAAQRLCAPEHAALAHEPTMICYSFGPMKELSAPCGGALVHGPAYDRQQLLDFLDSGARDRQWQGHGGINGLMNDVTAAHLLPQFDLIPRLYKKRQDVLETYARFLGPRLMTRPGEASGALAVIRDEDPEWIERVRRKLKSRSIETGHHYPVALDYKERFPQAFNLSKRILTLPCNVYMDAVAAAFIAHQVLSA